MKPMRIHIRWVREHKPLVILITLTVAIAIASMVFSITVFA